MGEPIEWTVERDGEWLNVLDGDGELRFPVARDSDPDYVEAITRDINMLVDRFNQFEGMRRELAHLVRLLEPLEVDGRTIIAGLATLNGARAALDKAAGKEVGNG